MSDETDDLIHQFTLTVEKTKSGMWVVTSDDLLGLLLVGKDLNDALDQVQEAGEALLGVIRSDQPADSVQRLQYEAAFG